MQRIHDVVELHPLGVRRGHPLEPERRLGGANACQPAGKDRTLFADIEIGMADDVERTGKHRFRRQEGFELSHPRPGMTRMRARRPATHETLGKIWKPRTPAKLAFRAKVPGPAKFLFGCRRVALQQSARGVALGRARFRRFRPNHRRGAPTKAPHAGPDFPPSTKSRPVTFLVQPRLVNDPFSDPGLLIDFRFSRRAILFDLGDIHALSSREILRVSHVFVSHTHMDHFAGFDRLLRLLLRRPAPLQLVGPEGFIDRVCHKLGAYTWNLLDEHAAEFSVLAMEFVGDRLARACRFQAPRAFEPEPAAPPELPAGIALDEEAFRVEARVLDHGIPCLAFALQEKLRINVRKAGLDRLGLPVGSWLNEAKRAIRRGSADDTPISVAPDRAVALGLLKAEAIRMTAGQKIAYVVDAAYHPANVERIVALARCADQLFIEAAFLEEDAPIAAERRHLTAAQAGRIARAAQADRVVPFHFSPRYLDREDGLRREVELAWRDNGP